MTSRDITAQKIAEEELAETTGRLQAILDHSPMAIYMRDLDERWIVANAETCGILGKTPEELIGQPDVGHIPARDLRASRRQRPRGHAGGGGDMSFDEMVPDTRTGEVRHVWSMKFPVRDAEGAVAGLGGVSLDVTDRERATRELDAARSLFEADVRLGSRRHGHQPRQRRWQHRGHRVQPRVRRDARTRAGGAAGHRRSCGDRASRRPAPSAGGCSTRCSPAARPPASCASSTATARHLRARRRRALTHGPDGEQTDRPAGGRHHRAQAPRGPAPGARRPGRADRALQPPALPGGARCARSAARAATDAPERCCCSTSTGSSRSTTARARGRRRAARRASARRCAAASASSDIVARIGGDEFALILPDTDVAAAAIVGDEARRGGVAPSGSVSARRPQRRRHRLDRDHGRAQRADPRSSIVATRMY